MIIKTKSERFQKQLIPIRRNDQYLSRLLSLLPYALFGGMVATLLFLDAVFALGGLGFADAQLTHPGSWPILPTRIIFQSALLFCFNPVAPIIALEPRSSLNLEKGSGHGRLY